MPPRIIRRNVTLDASDRDGLNAIREMFNSLGVSLGESFYVHSAGTDGAREFILQEMNEQNRLAPTRTNVRATRNRRPSRSRIRRITRRTFSQNPVNIRAELAERNVNAITFDGLDNALIGISEVSGLAVYERSLIIDTLINSNGLTYEDAVDFYESNIATQRGDHMPIIVDLGWGGEEASIAESADSAIDEDMAFVDTESGEIDEEPIERRPKKKRKQKEVKAQVAPPIESSIDTLEL